MDITQTSASKIRSTENEQDAAKILVVDDVPANLDVLITHLQQEKLELLVALSGEEGVELALDTRPDIILMDVMMPGIGGYEACRQLKSHPSTAHIPVIFLSAKTSDLDIEKGLAVGAVDYISKPYSLPILLKRINNHLEAKKHLDTITRLMATNAFTLSANRQHFDLIWQREWRRARRNHTVLSLILMELRPDFAREKNTRPVSLREQMISISDAMMKVLQRPADLLAHYEDWKFIALLPETRVKEARQLAKALDAEATRVLERSGLLKLEKLKRQGRNEVELYSMQQVLASTELTPKIEAEELLEKSQALLEADLPVKRLQLVYSESDPEL